MSTLIKQFAEKVYLQHGINVKKESLSARLSYQSFCNWIKSHKKLYKSYFSAFHTEIWAIVDDEPSYMTQKIEQ